MCEDKFHCMWCDHKMICVGLLKQDPRSGDEMTARIVPDALKKLRMCIFLFFFLVNFLLISITLLIIHTG